MEILEMIDERDAYNADTETENIHLREEIDEMKKGGSYWWRKWQDANDAIQGWMNQWRDAEDRVIKRERQLESSRKEYQQIASLFRDHLDKGEPEDDNDYESQARQILHNELDTDKQAETMGYDRDEVEPIPF